MTERPQTAANKLRSAATRAAWGLTLILVTVRFDGFDLFNNALGALLLYFAMRLLAPISGYPPSPHAPWANVAAVVLFALGVLDTCATIPPDPALTVVYGAVQCAAVVCILQHLASVCRRLRSPVGAKWWRRVAIAWIVLTVIGMAIAVSGGGRLSSGHFELAMCASWLTLLAMVAMLFTANMYSGSTDEYVRCQQCGAIAGRDPASVCERCQVCPRCSYPVAGVSGSVCPECGGMLVRPGVGELPPQEVEWRPGDPSGEPEGGRS